MVTLKKKQWKLQNLYKTIKSLSICSSSVVDNIPAREALEEGFSPVGSEKS